ncbi:CHAT domain-containing protein [Kitasatospora purpeofusca]|uniref:CHAT domain-containing protein n=1 Tax=Kitasatospora purpeofusca TaxID=67352 RepID=UPI0035DE2379
MSSSELPITVVKKLRTFIRQGQEKLDELNASLRRLGVPSLDPTQLRQVRALQVVEEQSRSRSVEKGIRWVESIDDYAHGFLERPLATRVMSNPRDFRDLEDAAELFENLRMAIGSRLETAGELVGPTTFVVKSTGRTNAVQGNMREPRREQLRILMLASSAEGDLRVAREQKRIREAVYQALHANAVDLDLRPAATAADLFDGITKFRPHVIHFSGHSNEELIVLEADVDELHHGAIVTAEAFANAVAATDDPPRLVVLNSCHSAHQIDHLVREVSPFAIGMADEVDDRSAITYAAQFYASIANGQSIGAAHDSGKAAVQVAGLPGHELPTLAHAEGANAWTAILVQRPA